jgi:sodium-independent sulfate anion transporter 11
LKYLPTTKLDAAFGLSALFSLYVIRFTFDKLSKKYPRRGKVPRSGMIL